MCFKLRVMGYTVGNFGPLSRKVDFTGTSKNNDQTLNSLLVNKVFTNGVSSK